MLDATNRIRNLLGNYRYVSYQIRLWKLRGLLGSGERNVETLFVNHALKQANLARPWSTLDLGCGNYPRNPFGADHTFGCDIREDLEANVSHCNLALEPIPKETESMDFITAYEFIEHVPRLIAGNTTRFPFVELMSEIHRVLKPGGFFFQRHLPIRAMRCSKIPHMSTSSPITPSLTTSAGIPMEALGAGFMDSMESFPWFNKDAKAFIYSHYFRRSHDQSREKSTLF